MTARPTAYGTSTSASVAGYRVKETLSGQSKEAVGRTTDVEGSLTINGTTVSAANFTVDLTTVSSDDSRRDGQFQGRIMNTSQFPTATFKLTSPISLGVVPAVGETVTKKATGDLTMHGVTKRITFDVTAKRVSGEFRISAGIPIHFADYNIDNPSCVHRQSRRRRHPRVHPRPPEVTPAFRVHLSG